MQDESSSESAVSGETSQASGAWYFYAVPYTATAPINLGPCVAWARIDFRACVEITALGNLFSSLRLL